MLTKCVGCHRIRAKMKTLLRSLPLFILSLFLFTACGSKDGIGTCPVGQIYSAQGCVSNQQAYNNGMQTGYNNTNSNCAANQVYTQLGCLGQGGPCTQGMGWDPKYNRCYAPIAGYNAGNNGGYNPANPGYNPTQPGYGTGWGGNIGINPSAGPSYNQCANGYAPTQQGCIPRCSFNYNGGMCVNY